jgi:ATP-binding cassette subfamily C protein
MSPALRAARRDLRLGGGLSLLLTAGGVLGALVVPIFDMHVLDRVLGSRSADSLWVLMLACLLGLGLFGAVVALRALVLEVVAERVTRHLSPAILAAGMRTALAGDVGAGGRALADLHELRSFLAGGAATAPLDLTLAPLLLTVLFLVHPSLGWYGLAAALLMLGCAVLTEAAVRPRLGLAQAGMERAIGGTAALLRDRSLDEAMGMGPAIAARWSTAQRGALGAMAEATLRGEGCTALARILRGLLQAGAVALAAFLVLRHAATPGAVVAANLLLAMLLAPLDSVLAQWRSVAGARLAWQRVVAALTLQAAEAAAPAAPGPGIVLEDVAWQPPEAEAPVFAGLSLRVAPGEIVLLTGPNGAGKSSLVRIAGGVRTPSAGRAWVDGLPAIAAAEAGRIGALPQRAQVIEGTVAETIARFGPAPPEALVAAARAAGLHEAIGRLPRGYATAIGPLDPVFSGGETRRLALARALFGDPPVLVLDEPDAGLDAEGEARLAAALAAARARGAAVLAVSHRAALRRIADRIVTLDGGRLADSDDHG